MKESSRVQQFSEIDIPVQIAEDSSEERKSEQSEEEKSEQSSEPEKSESEEEK